MLSTKLLASRLAAFFSLSLLGVVCSPAQAEERSFVSNGVIINYLDEGEGEPVVLLHGLTGGLEEWVQMGVVEGLSEHFRVLALDARGHGKSDKPHDPGSYGIEMSEDVLRLLDSLGIERVHVVGYSMGSVIAGKFAGMHPERARTVVLGGLAPVPDFIAPPPDAAPPNLPEPTLEELEEIQKRTDPQAIGALLTSFRNLALTSEQSAALQMPMLAIVGSEDPLRATVDEFSRMKPSMAVLVIDGATHAGKASAQANPAFIAAVRGFIAQN